MSALARPLALALPFVSCHASLIAMVRTRAGVRTQATQLGSQYWLVLWTQDVDLVTGRYRRHSLVFFLAGHALFAVALASATYCRTLIVAFMGLRASRLLHLNLLRSILAAPMAFFDTQPVGRLITRFSKDTELVDENLPGQLDMMFFMFLTVAGSLASIIAVTPWFAVAVLPLAVVYLRVMRYYLSTSRELKRLDAVTKSPVYAHFSETLGGLSTIRAFGMSSEFKDMAVAKVRPVGRA